jgi:hypothetical protein
VTSKRINQPVEEGQPGDAGPGYSHAVRSRTFVPLPGLLVSAVLALAVAGLRYERKRLMVDFGAGQQETAEQFVRDLERELADLDDDGRLVSTLLSRARTRPSLDAAEEEGFLLAGFQALATVVRVRPGSGASEVAIEIQDDGCGIAAEDLNAVFDSYFTTKKRGEGTGLGLPVAASIVSNHQGEIVLRSKKGSGSTVALTWPVAMEEVRVHA